MDATLPEPADFQVHQYTTTPSGSRAYDASGNTLVLDGGTPGERVLLHDYRGQVVSASSGGSLSSYCHDGLGRYVCRAGIPLRRSVWGPHGEIEEHEGSTARFGYISWSPGSVARIDERTDVDGDGSLDSYWLHRDEQDNVIAVTDASGAVVERYSYDDFGAPHVTDAGGTPLGNSAIGNPFLYRAARYEPATRLYGPAAYDPDTGRPVSGGESSLENPLRAAGPTCAPVSTGGEPSGSFLPTAGFGCWLGSSSWTGTCCTASCWLCTLFGEPCCSDVRAACLANGLNVVFTN
jgi:YD repeat-containing protein